MFARFDENPAMTLRVIKETKRYGRTDTQTDARTDGQRENSIPPTNKVCGGYNNFTQMSLFRPSWTNGSGWDVVLRYFLSRALAIILLGGAEPFRQICQRALLGTFL